uniref:Uncharacterized protein n=1 Tax=Picea glauca TaxID=3330 RepID=A0A101LUL9_PICGL|nr:hypothetical protein ABT39_MTgene2476 [Picea glauca]QHR88553.1 hypothetical protein Q903MT_gene2567 [Picea sitchensis]
MVNKTEIGLPVVLLANDRTESEEGSPESLIAKISRSNHAFPISHLCGHPFRSLSAQRAEIKSELAFALPTPSINPSKCLRHII